MNFSIWGVLVQSWRGGLSSPSHGLWSKLKSGELLEHVLVLGPSVMFFQIF